MKVEIKYLDKNGVERVTTVNDVLHVSSVTNVFGEMEDFKMATKAGSFFRNMDVDKVLEYKIVGRVNEPA